MPCACRISSISRTTTCARVSRRAIGPSCAQPTVTKRGISSSEQCLLGAQTNLPGRHRPCCVAESKSFDRTPRCEKYCMRLKKLQTLEPGISGDEPAQRDELENRR